MKRLTSLLLVVALCMGLCSSFAFAADGDATTDAIDAQAIDDVSKAVKNTVTLPEGDNMLAGMEYNVTSTMAEMADDGIKATDGQYRGDGVNEWNGDTKGDASIEWMGTGGTVTYTFTFDEPADVDVLVFKSVRVAGNRQFGTVTVNNGTAMASSQLSMVSISGAPLYTNDTVTDAEQYFDVIVPVDLKGITKLTVSIVTDAYCCQYDEIEAYGKLGSNNYVGSYLGGASAVLSGDTKVEIGDTVSINVYVNDISTPNGIVACDLPLNYDASLLRLVSAQPIVPAAWGDSYVDLSPADITGVPYMLSLACNADDLLTNTDYYITENNAVGFALTFTALDNGRAVVSIKSDDDAGKYALAVDAMGFVNYGVFDASHKVTIGVVEEESSEEVSSEEVTSEEVSSEEVSSEEVSSEEVSSEEVSSEEVSSEEVSSEEVSSEEVSSEDSSEDSDVVEPELPANGNLLYQRPYTVVSGASPHTADSGTMATDGFYRGDGVHEFDSDYAVEGTTIEWYGTTRTISYTFAFAKPTDINKIVIRGVRIYGNRQFGTLTINGVSIPSTDVQKAVIEGAPTSSQSGTDQYFDITVPVELFDVTQLVISILTDAYAYQFDEIEAYGPNTSKVSFVAEHGTIIGDAVVNVENGTNLNTVTFPTVTADPNYVFIGWDMTEGIINSDTVVAAQFALKTYTVSFIGADGQVLSQHTVPYGASVTAPQAPEIEGYTFKGWSDEDGNIVDSFEVVSKDASFTAVYDRALVVIKFAASNGTLSFAQTEVEYGTDLSDVEYPTVTPATGYHFVAWDVTEGVVKAEITVTASFALNTYIVIFNSTDGELLSQQTVTYGFSATAPEAPEVEGSAFKCWVDEEGNPVSDFSVITRDITLTATYKPLLIKVNFAAENGTLSFAQTEVEYGTDLSDVEYPTVTPATGYHFVAWDVTEGVVKAEITVTASFALNTYTVSFNSAVGELLSQQTVTYGFSATAPEAPEVEGSAFKCWVDEDGNPVSDFSVITRDITLTATYKPLLIKVNFAAENGMLSFAQTEVEYGTDLSAVIYPNVIPNAGYRFIAWDVTEGAVYEEITLYALFALKSYTVSFKDADGSVLSNQNVFHGHAAIEPTVPVAEGISFAGWVDAEGVLISDFSCITQNITVTATYEGEATVYTVTFKGVDGTVVSVQKAPQGGAVTAPAAPEFDGYSFVGWVDSDGTVVNSFDNITQNAVYIASYKVKETEPLAPFTFTDEADTSYVAINETKGYLTFRNGAMTAGDIMAMFKDTQMTITKANGTPVADGTLASTGCIITTTTESGVTASLTILVYGDVNGDGRITTSDYGRILSHIKGHTVITGVGRDAANVVGSDDNITTGDYGRIISYIKGNASHL